MSVSTGCHANCRWASPRDLFAPGASTRSRGRTMCRCFRGSSCVAGARIARANRLPLFRRRGADLGAVPRRLAACGRSNGCSRFLTGSYGAFVVATFIDFEHFIIPDEITWGGAAAGLLLSLAIPTLQGKDAKLIGGVGAWSARSQVTRCSGPWSSWARTPLAGASSLRRTTALRWVRRGQDADLTVGERGDGLERFLRARQ